MAHNGAVFDVAAAHDGGRLTAWRHRLAGQRLGVFEVRLAAMSRLAAKPRHAAKPRYAEKPRHTAKPRLAAEWLLQVGG